MATHKKVAGKKVALDPKLNVEHVGYVAVDSGQVIIGDPCYVQDVTLEDTLHMDTGTSCRLDDMTPEDRAQLQAQPSLGTEEGMKIFDKYMKFHPAGQITGGDLVENIPHNKKYRAETLLPRRSIKQKYGNKDNSCEVAVLCGSFGGDGTYPVYVTTADLGRRERTVVSLTVVFHDQERIQDALAFLARFDEITAEKLWLCSNEVCPSSRID
ncbi:MAG: hypothetical protein WBC04_03275 [Candidatus Acidiferrales bacterium]